MSCFEYPRREGAASTLVLDTSPAEEIAIGDVINVMTLGDNDILNSVQADGLPAGNWTLGLFDRDIVSGELTPLLNAITTAVTTTTGIADLLSGGPAANTFDIRFQSLHESWTKLLEDVNTPFPVTLDRDKYGRKHTYILGLIGTVAIPAGTEVKIKVTRAGDGY